MRRPEVALDNREAVYAFYTSYRPHKATYKALYGLMGVAFKPTVGFAPGVRDRVQKAFDEGRTLIIAANHLRLTDPFVIAGTTRRVPELNPFVGSSFIPSKEENYHFTKFRPAATAIRYVIDGLGAIPVFRGKDVGSGNMREYVEAGRMFQEVSVKRLNEGLNMGIFVEGERNRTDPKKLQRVVPTIGKIICGVTEREQPLVLTWALQYPGGNRKPVEYLGHLSEGDFTKPKEVNDWIFECLQKDIDLAAEIG